jgi:glycosyltransferase involved in cell wall biosynthesis
MSTAVLSSAEGAGMHEPPPMNLRPATPEAGLWSLQPAPLAVYRCWTCGLYGMRPHACCGRRTRRVPAPYYVAIGAPPERSPEFSVILVAQNALPYTRATVESLRRARGGHSVEFVFVDGCSTDGTLNYIRELARREVVQLIVAHPEESFRYARGANRGAEAASGRLLLFPECGSETRDQNLFDRLALAASDARAGVVGTMSEAECGGAARCRADLPAGMSWSPTTVTGALWGVRTEVFAELGGLVPAPCDQDAALALEYRALKRNYRLAVVASVVEGVGRDPGQGSRVQGQGSGDGVADGLGSGTPDGRSAWKGRFLAHRYPRISVAIACRDYARYLPRALDSVLGSYLPADTGLQIVVVDDASTDETPVVLQEYCRRYPEQVNVLRRTVSHGPAPAKNRAMDRCIGDYVALLDADDEFLEYKLWHCLDTLDAAGADFLYHDFIQVNADGRQEWYRIGRWSLERWRRGTRLPPGVWMFRNGIVRFGERQITGEDPDFLRRNWHGLRTVYLPEALTRYHLHGTGLSARAMCKVVTGQLKGLACADVSACTDRGLREG